MDQAPFRSETCKRWQLLTNLTTYHRPRIEKYYTLSRIILIHFSFVAKIRQQQASDHYPRSFLGRRGYDLAMDSGTYTFPALVSLKYTTTIRMYSTSRSTIVMGRNRLREHLSTDGAISLGSYGEAPIFRNSEGSFSDNYACGNRLHGKTI